MTIDELESLLGPPEHFIMTTNSRKLLTEWAIASGHAEVNVSLMTNVQLLNLYTAKGTKSKSDFDLRLMAAEMVVTILKNMPKPEIDEELIRNLVEKYASTIQTKRIEVVQHGQLRALEGIIHYKTEIVIRIASIGHHVMLVGPAGCGKTTIGEHTAKALSLPFYITSTINETHELSGFIDGHGTYHRTPFREAFEHGGIWVADEIDAWDASALLAANSALANGQAVFPDAPTPVRRHPNFRMIATANTFGNGADRVYIGRNELDAASLDRFAVIPVDYDLNLERIFCNGNEQWLERVWRVRKAVNDKKIRHVVSSRAIIYGASALAIGLTKEDVEDIYLFKGMNAKDRERIG